MPCREKHCVQETLAFSTSGFGGLSAFGFRCGGKGDIRSLAERPAPGDGAPTREPPPAWHTYWFGRIGASCVSAIATAGRKKIGTKSADDVKLATILACENGSRRPTRAVLVFGRYENGNRHAHAVLVDLSQPARPIKPASQRTPLCTETVLVHGPY